MVRAHRQAWAWQDEWIGLTMEDIRQIERETQLALQQKMAVVEAAEKEATIGEHEANSDSEMSTANSTHETDVGKTLAATLGSIEKNEDLSSPPSSRKPSDIQAINTALSLESGEIIEKSLPTPQTLR